jgi:hypothetical protein
VARLSTSCLARRVKLDIIIFCPDEHYLPCFERPRGANLSLRFDTLSTRMLYCIQPLALCFVAESATLPRNSGGCFDPG